MIEYSKDDDGRIEINSDADIEAKSGSDQDKAALRNHMSSYLAKDGDPVSVRVFVGEVQKSISCKFVAHAKPGTVCQCLVLVRADADVKEPPEPTVDPTKPKV